MFRNIDFNEIIYMLLTYNIEFYVACVLLYGFWVLLRIKFIKNIGYKIPVISLIKVSFNLGACVVFYQLVCLMYSADWFDIWIILLNLFLLTLWVLFHIILSVVVKHVKFDVEMFLLLLISFLGLIFLTKVDNFIMYVIAFELFSLPIYILICSESLSPKSTEAGLKYFILGSLFSAIQLQGIAIIYCETGCSSFKELFMFTCFLDDYTQHNMFLIFGVILVITNIFFKLAIVPFHIGTPDAYEGAPFLTFIYLNIFPKIPLFILLINIFRYIIIDYGNIYQIICTIFAITSIIYACIAILNQNKLKRIITYSMIGNTGFVLFSISDLSAKSLSSAFYFLIFYSLIMLGLFSCLTLLRFHLASERFDNISILINLYNINKNFSVIMAIFLFSLGSLPPLVGFFIKFMLFDVYLEFNLVFFSCLVILFSVLMLIVYLRLIKLMFFSFTEDNWNIFVKWPFSISILISFMFLINILFVLFADTIFTYIYMGVLGDMYSYESVFLLFDINHAAFAAHRNYEWWIAYPELMNWYDDVLVSMAKKTVPPRDNRWLWRGY